MKNKTKTLKFVFLLISFISLSAFGQISETVGTITKVTVYRGQALVTRSVEVDLPAGSSEIIVKNLPPQIIADSIYAQSDDDLKILSVRYRQRAVREDTREEVKQLDAQIEETKTKIYHTERKKGHLDNQWDMFIKLRQFVADAKNIDTNRGLLQFEPVRDIVNFILTKADEYIEKTLSFEDEIVELQKALELLERERKELTIGSSRTERQALIYIASSGSKKAQIELNYLVNGANWDQQYNLRANPDSSTVTIEYSAVINQVSGENWNNVTLSLSTAEPTMVAEPPVLGPMLISLSLPAPVQQQADSKAPQVFFDEFRRQRNLRRTSSIKGIKANEELNLYATRNQILLFNIKDRDIQRFQQQLAEIARIEGVSVTYDLPGSLALPSRSDRQFVSIASITAKADFTLLASPLLTDYVYLQAETLNDSNTILLPAPASMFCDGRFVGKGSLPLVTIGEKFTAGFGIDSQIQVTHELEQKKTRIQGGNRIDTYDYRIALSNYKNTHAKLRLLDRLPYSDDPSIKIELTKTSVPLSEDTEYVRSLKKKGILRWDIELEPNTTGEKATIVKYSFTTEYDKNMQLQPTKKN